MSVTRLAFEIVAALLGAVLLTVVLGPLVAWFLPLVVAILLVRFWKTLSLRSGLLLFAIAGTINGLWAWALLNEGGRLPPGVRTFLTLHIDPQAELATTRYAPVGVSGPEFLGILCIWLAA
jgi:hypothetical protein